MKESLQEILQAEQGIVCFVGAGGKKTTMFRLAKEHTGRTGITATAHIEYFPKTLEAAKYIEEEETLLDKIHDDNNSRVIAFAQPSSRRGRRAGISPDRVSEFYKRGRFELLLIKSDGARSRLMKAPAEHEPPIPQCADTVIPVISARVIGRKLTEKRAHRIEQITRITGLKENEIIQPVHLARILASEEGALKNTGKARIVPLINMVDDQKRKRLAMETAKIALELSGRFNSIVLASMRSETPVVEVVII